MLRKTVPISGIKTAGLEAGTFEGWASTFGNVDMHGDRVMPGAFGKSLASGRVIPLMWMHKSDDPRGIVGEVIDAAEVAEGLKIKGRFDLDTSEGSAAYRAVKSRRVDALSIGYRVNTATKADDGVNELRDLDLIEVSVVTRGANPAATIEAVKSAAGRPTAPIRSALARACADRYIQRKADNTMKYVTRTEKFTKDREVHLSDVKRLLDTADAEGRDLTPEESERIEVCTKAAAACDVAIAQAEADAKFFASAQAMAAEIGGPVGAGTPATSGHLAMTGTHAKAMAAKIVAAMPRDPQGTKGLVAAGSQVTSTIVVPEVAPQGRPAVSVLDVLPMRIVAPNYITLRQTTRDFFDGSPTAAGELKPESDVTVTAIEGRLRVVAHVSTPIDKYILSDASAMEQFVAQEMLYGLRRGLEAQLLTGDGEGENITGVLATEGIQTQEFSVDTLTSVRRALTKLDVEGFTAGLIVLSAADWEGIELLTATSGATDRAIPVDPVARRLWGVPVVLNQGLGTGVGLVIGENAVSVDHDGVIETLWSDSHSDLFQRNQLVCRQEGRFNLSVTQPAAIVEVQTSDVGS